MNLFGTDGIRNKVGTFPFTSEALPRLGEALITWAQEKYGPTPDFLIARDTRSSGSWIKACLSSGMLQHNSILYDAHVLPTPALFHMLRNDKRYTCGIIITASHNPAEDNGIKIIDRDGKITKDDENRISELLSSLSEKESYAHFGLELQIPHAEELYIQALRAHFKPQFLKGHTIVLDCAHGATFRVAPELFRALGAQVIALNCEPNGHNINKNCGALHLTALQEAVIKHQALVGFAFDGDGDRVIAVSKQGMVKDGDDIVCLLLQHPSYADIPVVVGTVMANKGFETHLTHLGKQFVRTAVGDKYVNKVLSENKYPLGGEPSGHIILHSLIPTGDGMLVALKVLETMLITNNFEFTTFEKYPNILINVPVTHKKALDETPLKDIILKSESLVPEGRVLVRYSGTEHLIRVMVEDAKAETAKTVAHNLALQLQQALS